MSEVIKVECAVCGKVYVGKLPPNGDGSELYPRMHRDSFGVVCRGSDEYGEWVDEDD